MAFSFQHKSLKYTAMELHVSLINHFNPSSTHKCPTDLFYMMLFVNLELTPHFLIYFLSKINPRAMILGHVP